MIPAAKGPSLATPVHSPSGRKPDARTVKTTTKQAENGITGKSVVSKKTIVFRTWPT